MASDAAPPLPPSDAGRIIGIEFVYTRQEAIRSSRAATRVVLPLYRFIPWFGILLLVLAAYILGSAGNTGWSGAISGGLGLLFVSVPLLTRWQIVRSFRQMPSANGAISWEISEHRLVTRGPGGQAVMAWSALTRVVSTRHGFLLFTSPRIGHWLPRHAFTSEEDLQQFQTWVDVKQPSFGTGGDVQKTASSATPGTSAEAPGEAVEAITARFIYTENDATAAHQLVLGSLPWYLRYFSVLPITFVVVILAIQNESIVVSLITVFFVAAFTGFALWRKRRKQRQTALDTFAKSPDANREICWTISQQLIAIRSEHSNSAYGWKSVLKVRESDEGFLVFPHPHIGSWLPHRAFASPHDAALLRAWVNRHGIDYRRVQRGPAAH